MEENTKIDRHENYFKFVLSQKEDVILERIFSADNYNPVIRYSVDVRKLLGNYMKRLDSVLNRKKLNFELNEYNTIEFYKENKKFIGKNNKLVVPKKESIKIGEKTIKGVQNKIGLYLNNKPIVEREFYVYNYNPEARFSVDLLNTFNEIVEELQDYLRETDIRRMWEDYDIIHRFNLNIQQVRDMSEDTRQKYLKRLKMKNKPVFSKK